MTAGTFWLQALRTLVREPQLVVDLFLNYDCDLDAKNIVGSMCDGLSHLTVSQQVRREITDYLVSRRGSHSISARFT